MGSLRDVPLSWMETRQVTIEALPGSVSGAAPSERFQSCAARTSVVVTVILPPCGVNFTALLQRFDTT